MNSGKINKKIIGAGTFAAIAASLCCIAPLLALFAGVAGLASAFDWIEPLRPYLIGLTVLTLGFAWRQILTPKKEIECECETDEKKSFLQTKSFLAIVTVFAVLALSFPYYNSYLFANGNKTEIVSQTELTSVNLKIEGMTCEGCEVSVANYAENAGAVEVTSNHETGLAAIKFDERKTNVDSIVHSIGLLGYKVNVIENDGKENSLSNKN
ncbi:MAG: mercuric transport protein MerTP [Chlorobi bacterium]|nr:mercuric transport protein MerTP [Chlorobiota bacterium]